MVSNGLRERLRRSLGGQAFSQAVAGVIQIGGVPLFLHFWGAPLYGEWLVLAAFPAYITIGNLGFVNATWYEATMCVARGDLDGASGAFRSTWVFVTIVSLLLAAVLLAVTAVSPVSSWFEFSRLEGSDASTVLALLLFQVLVSIQTGLAAVGLISIGRYGSYAFLMASTRLAGFVLTALVLALGVGPVSVAVVMAGVECAGLAVTAGLARRHGSWMRYGFSGASRATLRRLAAPSLGFAGFTAGNAISIQGPVIVIGAVIGPTAVSVFVTLRLLVRGVVMLANVVFAPLRIEIATAYGRGDIELVRRLNTRVIQFALWLAVTASVALMLLGPWFVDVWTSGQIIARQPLFAWLLVAGMATLLWTGAATALYATNNSAEIAAAYVIVGSVGMAASIAAAFYAGPGGVAAALALAELGVLALILMRTLAFLDQGFGALVAATLRPPTDLPGLFRRGP